MNEEIFIPITLFVSAALMIMVIAYYRSRETLAMIERGMNPKLNEGKPAPYRAFRWGMLLIGAGSGMLIAYLIDQTTSWHDTESIYFALIAIGAGIGLIISHKAEKAYLDQHPNDGTPQ